MRSTIFSSSLVLMVSAMAEVAMAGVVIAPAAGFNISWDGNEGDHFSADGASVPDNRALAANGAIPFGDHNTWLGLQYGFPTVHSIAYLNDGVYGNSNSWIGPDEDGSPGGVTPYPAPHFAGINLNGTFNLTAIAWGRDNGRDDIHGDPGGGQLTDRSLGDATHLYTVQVTTVSNPDYQTPDGSWTTVGTLDYQSDEDPDIGEGFTSYFRHQYGLSVTGGGPILATGVRIIVPFGDATAIGTAIDEIEVYGSVAVPPLVPGDFDGDGDVDGADFVAWQTHFPTSSGATLATGDADGDGDVDGADFVVWQTHFPFTPPGPAVTPVPEPGSIILLAIGGIVALAHRKLRRA